MFELFSLTTSLYIKYTPSMVLLFGRGEREGGVIIIRDENVFSPPLFSLTYTPIYSFILYILIFSTKP